MSVPPNDVSAPPPPLAGSPGAEEKQWAMFAHLSALLGGIFTGFWFGFGCFIGPLIIWLVKKDTMPFVSDQAKEALNFNITLAIVGVAMLILTVITLGIGLLIVIPLGAIVGIGWLILTIVAAIKANEGVAYRYPISLRLIK
ncbi:MAG: DUF4870 domain-containing protein [Rudaea sp.]|nr:DUF4870 domain-containing protein [Rudaea sp.]